MSRPRGSSGVDQGSAEGGRRRTMFCRLDIERIGATSWRLLFFDDIAVAVTLTVPSSMGLRGSSASPGKVAIKVPSPLSILTIRCFDRPEFSRLPTERIEPVSVTY